MECVFYILFLSRQRYYSSEKCQNLAEDNFPSDSFVRNFYCNMKLIFTSQTLNFICSLFWLNGTAIVKE